jgi:hypothetical protein
MTFVVRAGHRRGHRPAGHEESLPVALGHQDAMPDGLSTLDPAAVRASKPVREGTGSIRAGINPEMPPQTCAINLRLRGEFVHTGTDRP